FVETWCSSWFLFIRKLFFPTTMIERRLLPDVDRDLDSFSIIEKLPCDLVRQIIECTPESVCNLRLTSRTLRARVDELAQSRATIPLAKQITFVGGLSSDKYDKRIDISILMLVCNSMLFELRLRESGFDKRQITKHVREYPETTCM
ncbi:hypothetical protein PMAYCL1PPCAC_22334, partial [Pristionchus mayeri]